VSNIRFYLDENIANAVAEGLRTKSIDVLTTPEAGNMGKTDPEHLAFALAQNRVLVTQDDDFLTLVSVGIAHAGIAYYKPQTRIVKEILHGLFTLYDNSSQEDMRNLVRYL
jgi:hypothetical protein